MRVRRFFLAECVVTRWALMPPERGGSVHPVRVGVRHFNEQPTLRLRTQIVEPGADVHITCVLRDVCYPRQRVHS